MKAIASGYLVLLLSFCSLARGEERNRQTAMELCTYRISDVPPPDFFRVTIDEYSRDCKYSFLHLTEKAGDVPGSRWVPVAHFEKGFISRAKCQGLLNKVKGLQPESLRSLRGSSTPRFVSYGSSIMLKGMFPKEIILSIPASPAYQESIDSHGLPEGARNLVEILWMSRGLVTDLQIKSRAAPPALSGHCLTGEWQRYANDLLGRLRSTGRK